MMPPPALIPLWACGECGEVSETAQEATFHCDEDYWQRLEEARNLELRAAGEVLQP